MLRTPTRISRNILFSMRLASSSAIEGLSIIQLHDAPVLLELQLQNGCSSRIELRGFSHDTGSAKTTVALGVLQNHLKGMDVLSPEALSTVLPVNAGITDSLPLNVSLAIASAAAAHQELPLHRYLSTLSHSPSSSGTLLPAPMLNITHPALARLNVYKVALVPRRTFRYADIFSAARTVREKLDSLVSTQLGSRKQFKSHEQALDTLVNAIETAGFQGQLGLALDVDAREFYTVKGDTYGLDGESAQITPDDLMYIYKSWVQRYPIVYLEDACGVRDVSGWQSLTRTLGSQTLIAANRLFDGDSQEYVNVDKERFEALGPKRNVGNAVVIMPERASNVQQLIDLVKAADSRRYVSIAASDSDNGLLADLAVGMGMRAIKLPVGDGAELSLEQRLKLLESQLGTEARYATFSKLARVGDSSVA